MEQNNAHCHTEHHTPFRMPSTVEFTACHSLLKIYIFIAHTVSIYFVNFKVKTIFYGNAKNRLNTFRILLDMLLSHHLCILVFLLWEK